MTSRIESLTDAQIACMAEYRDRWIEIGLDTRPADRSRAEAGLRQAYEAAEKPHPSKIVWCTSPLAAALARAIVLKELTSVRASVWDSVWASVGASVRASVWASVGASVGDSVGASVGASVWDSVWASVWDSVWASVWASVGASVWDSVGDSVWASVGASVWDSVGASVWASVRASVWASVGASVWDSVGDSVWASVGASVWDSVGASVWASVRASVGDSVGDSGWEAGYGQHDANWLAFYEYFRYVCNLTNQTDKLNGLTEIAKSANWFWPHEKIVWISERHTVVKKDERGRLHSPNGAAVLYPDGWGVWAWHGTRVAQDVIENPHSITVERIEKEDNAEVRRVMMERFGYDAYIQSSNAKLIESSDEGKLWWKNVPNDEPVVMVEVINSTPEPDGTRKTYFLRVDPNAYAGDAGRYVRAAKASTWRRGKDNALVYRDWRDYQPQMES